MEGRAGLLIAAVGVALASIDWFAVATAQSTKPKPPPGRDPGGIAIAVIGNGLDYRRPEIAGRVARDGEGELIGWDFADNDGRPFAASDADGGAARVVLAEGQGTRLVLARAAAGRPDQTAAALRFCAQTPARVVLVLTEGGASLPISGLAEAGRSLPHLLLVVPAQRVAADFESGPKRDRGGLLIVAAEGSAAPADVAVVPPADSHERPDGRAAPDDLAAARVTALAARVLAAAPALDGASLRQRLLTFVKAQGRDTPVIPNAERLHRQE